MTWNTPPPLRAEAPLDTDTLAQERARLVRLCARATGDPDAAEDLAQETLFEAWRAAHKLRPGASPDERGRWLAVIARNVCRRWGRRRGREVSRRVFPFPAEPRGAQSEGSLSVLAQVPDGFDLEAELERRELVGLLDRAMGLLPPETRRVLYERIVAQFPLAAMAHRFGLSQGAVAMRLQRGKHALRHVLTTALLRESLSLGLFVPDDVGWQQTRLWCSYCGRRRLEGRFSAEHETLGLRCPDCGTYSHSRGSPRNGFGWDEVHGYRARLARIWQWCGRAHLSGLESRRVVCAGCGRHVHLRVATLAAGAPAPAPRLQLSAHCAACGSGFQEAHDWLMLCLPEAQRFLHDHPRIRFAGLRPVNAQGVGCTNGIRRR